MTKEVIAQNEQFLPLPQCFPLLVIGCPLNYRDFLFFDKICLKSSAADMRERVKWFPHADAFQADDFCKLFVKLNNYCVINRYFPYSDETSDTQLQE